MSGPTEVTREAHGGRARSSGRGFISHVHRASPWPAAGRRPGRGLFSGELWGGSGWLPRWCKPHGAIYTHCKTCRGKGREKLLKKRGFAGTVLCPLSCSSWRRCGVLNRGSRPDRDWRRLQCHLPWQKVSPAPSSLTGGVSSTIFPDRRCLWRHIPWQGLRGRHILAESAAASVIPRFSCILYVFQVISCSTYWGSPSRAVQLLGKWFPTGMETMGLPISEGHGFPGRCAVCLPCPVWVYAWRTWGKVLVTSPSFRHFCTLIWSGKFYLEMFFQL